MSAEPRVPPHDLDAEAAILSAILLHGSELDKITSFLRPENFYSEAHRQIFAAMLELAAVGKPTDIVQVGTWLKDRQRIGQIGGMPYLTEILNASPAVADVRAYARTVHEKFRVRNLIATCQRISAQGYLDYGEVEAFLESSEHAVHLAAHAMVERETLKHAKEYVKEMAVELARAAQIGAGGVSGTSTSFAKWDSITTGMHGGELWIVGARPGMGKTALLEAILRDVAKQERVGAEAVEKYAAGICSLEMPGRQLVLRSACADGRVSVSEARAAGMSAGAMARLSASSMNLATRNLWIDERPAMTLAGVRATTRRIAREARKAGAVLKVMGVDYLQLMTGGGNGSNREQEISEISRGLKALAKEEDITVVALAQLNREVEKRGNKRPMLSDLRESGAIEQDADTICFLYREDYYREPADPKAGQDVGLTELIIAKQRNGPTGMVRIRFDAYCTRFYDYEEY